MDVIFGIIAFITWWAFVVGMVRPKLVRMKGRKQVALVYLITSLVCSIISGATSKPVQEVPAKTKEKAHAVEAISPELREQQEKYLIFLKEWRKMEESLHSSFKSCQKVTSTAEKNLKEAFIESRGMDAYVKYIAYTIQKNGKTIHRARSWMKHAKDLPEYYEFINACRSEQLEIQKTAKACAALAIPSGLPISVVDLINKGKVSYINYLAIRIEFLESVLQSMLTDDDYWQQKSSDLGPKTMGDVMSKDYWGNYLWTEVPRELKITEDQL